MRNRVDRHVPDDLLGAFVDGDVDEQVAVHVAEHLDECPACATRAVALEPLGSAFAAVEDPVAPPDLAAAVLAAAQQPERGPAVEIGVGAGLLVAAGLMCAIGGEPIAALIQLGRFADAVSRVGAHLAPGGLAAVMLPFALLSAVGGLLAWSRSTLDSGADLPVIPRRLR